MLDSPHSPALPQRDEHRRAWSFRDAEANIGLDGKSKKRLLKERTGNERGEAEGTKHGGNEQTRFGTERKRMYLNTKGEVSTTVLAFRTCIWL